MLVRFAKLNISTLSSSSASFDFNNRSISFNALNVCTIPPISGRRLRKINIETTIAAAASATSEVTISINLARRDATITAKLLRVSAKTC